MSIFEEERRKKRLKAETEEKLNTLGQRSDYKAKTWVQKEVKQSENEALSFFQNAALVLKNLKKRKYYVRYLTQIFLHHAAEEDLPKKYQIDVEANDIGVIVRIKGTRYIGAFKALGIPSYDFHACKIMAVKLGNTIAKLEGYAPTTEGGIVLPDQEDLKRFRNA